MKRQKKFLRRNKKINLGEVSLIKSPKKRVKRGGTIVKVVGVGGGGGNAITRMFEGGRMRGIEFIAVNTDAQDLHYASAHHKVLIGRALTRGLGAGMNPEIGKKAVEENRSEVLEVLEGADIVFLTSGFGGGTGSAATPVIAEALREKGTLTIAVITKPFAFEGAERSRIAQEGLANIRDKVDALVVIPNDRIFSLISKDTSVTKAFGFVDDVLRQAILSLTEIINYPGIINVDFSDIKTIVKDSGTTMIGVGAASGAERSVKAVTAALNSPLLETSIDGARRVLFAIAGGKNLKMSEINDIAKAVSANLDSNAKIIFGAYHDRSLKDKSIKVTVIASGFNGLYSNNRGIMPTLFVQSKPKTNVSVSALDSSEDEGSVLENKKNDKDKEGEPPEKQGLQKTEVWDIPAFLRRRRR